MGPSHVLAFSEQCAFTDKTQLGSDVVVIDLLLSLLLAKSQNTVNVKPVQFAKQSLSGHS